jgi:hypothetical protein
MVVGEIKAGNVSLGPEISFNGVVIDEEVVVDETRNINVVEVLAEVVEKPSTHKPNGAQ